MGHQTKIQTHQHWAEDLLRWSLVNHEKTTSDPIKPLLSRNKCLTGKKKTSVRTDLRVTQNMAGQQTPSAPRKFALNPSESVAFVCFLALLLTFSRFGRVQCLCRVTSPPVTGQQGSLWCLRHLRKQASPFRNLPRDWTCRHAMWIKILKLEVFSPAYF